MNNELSKKKTRKTILFTVESKQKFYILAINVTKVVREVYNGNYSTLKRKIEENI